MKSKQLGSSRLSTKTLSSYASHVKLFEEFCGDFGYGMADISDLVLAQFIAWAFFEKDLPGSTIKNYLEGGIEDHVRTLGLRWHPVSGPTARENMRMSFEALEAARKEENTTESASRRRVRRGPAVPAKFPQFQTALHKKLGHTQPILSKSMWLLMTMLLTGACRSADLVGKTQKRAHIDAACWENLTFGLEGSPFSSSAEECSSFQLHLRGMKNEKRRPDTVITFESYKDFGIDPVQAMKELRAELVRQGMSPTGCIFRQDYKLRPLTYSHARTLLIEVGLEAGWLRSECFLHSPRIGLASAAAAAGVPVAEIAKLGRWKCLSSVEGYIRVFAQNLGTLVRAALSAPMDKILHHFEHDLHGKDVLADSDGESDEE